MSFFGQDEKPLLQLLPFFHPLSTSSSTSLCVYGSSSGYFYSFNAFLSLYHSLEARIAPEIRISDDGNVGFSPDSRTFSAMCTLFLTFPAPTKASTPSHCVLIDSIRQFYRRFSYHHHHHHHHHLYNRLRCDCSCSDILRL